MMMRAKDRFRMSQKERQNRYFSTEFKIKKVREIETGISKVSEICKEYSVTDTAVYRWVKKYGTTKEKRERMIVESKSDTKTIVALRDKISDLEQLLGQKEVLLIFQEKMLDYAQEYCGVDIKKKFLKNPSSTSGKTPKN